MKDFIVTNSEKMQRLMKNAQKIADSNCNVLIYGETGTQKDLLAKYVHNNSKRKLKPFVSVNCGALRETVLESELFGHEKGSFTGAYNRKIGLAEAANGGTLFLDEIGELSPGIQAKLLRFIQEGELYRVGGKDPIRVDIRLISATNRELEAEVQKGNFREDLFYRINTIVLPVPPLRERKEDIKELLGIFNKHEFNVIYLDEAIKPLMNYDWPGNILELENFHIRMMALYSGEIIDEKMVSSALPKNKELGAVEYSPNITLYDLEKNYILKAMAFYGEDRSRAAASLGITIKTLYNKLHEYGVLE